MDILIFGSTSNICAIRVYDNLNKLTNSINRIYCYGSRKWTTNEFIDLHYLKKVKITNIDEIKSKITYISGKYNIDGYNNSFTDIINDNMIIYVATPNSCYNDILNFVNKTNKKCKVVLEKPLATNFNQFKDLSKFFTSNTSVIDHFLYKQDIINLINCNKGKEFKSVRFQFNYTDDVEDRLGYFDNAGFFIDMFQSHFLSVIYCLIGDEIKDFESLDIIRNIRKTYIGYGGKNNVDTYFYLEFKFKNTIYIFEAGKAMKEESKRIYLDNIEFKINNYHNEYELYFTDLFNNKLDSNLIYLHEYFWKITDKINRDFHSNSKYGSYIKNSF